MSSRSEVRKRRFVEPRRFHDAVLRQVIQDEIDEFDLVRGQRPSIREPGQRLLGGCPGARALSAHEGHEDGEPEQAEDEPLRPGDSVASVLARAPDKRGRDFAAELRPPPGTGQSNGNAEDDEEEVLNLDYVPLPILEHPGESSEHDQNEAGGNDSECHREK